MQGNLYNTRINNENVQMDAQNKGWLNGLVGVMIFAGSMPATRIAVTGFNPEFLTGARAVIAGLFALLILVVFKQRMPQLKDFIPLCITALGVVLGFPLFTALALQEISAARALVFVALLPLSTAIFGVFRAAERPSLAFWLFALIALATSVKPSGWNMGSPPLKVTLANSSASTFSTISSVLTFFPLWMSHDSGLWQPGHLFGQPAA